MTFILFCICTGFYCGFLRRWRSHPGFTFFGISAFYIICILWIPFYAASNLFLDLDWQYPIRDWEISYIAGVFVTCVMLCNLVRRAFRLAPIEHRLSLLARLAGSSRGRVYMLVATGVSVACIAGLYHTKGVALNVGNYGSRFESNTGTGLFSILSYAIVSVAVLRLFKKPRLSSMLTSLLIVIAYGMALFLTLGGARNYLIAAIVPVLLASYSLRIIRERQLVLYLVLGTLGLTALAMVRYGDALNAGSTELIAIYTRDTVFPVQSLNLLFYSSQIHFVGFKYFFNQAYAIIPRGMWPGKPVYLDTIAYYFADQVLAYGKGLIIAPTGLGSLYLMGGWPYVIVGTLLVFILFIFVDYLIFNGKSIVFICIWPSLFFAFFSFRESIELGLYKIVVHAIGTLLIYAVSMSVCQVLPKRTK
ncbi:WzyE family oligosaccharide polymerase [Paraburkholderia rhizosphaerae]|uniref:WzyE protein n=1 Tax=Paraburkholderia rhizosphaerae TaxID=480658 RepID=A0A4R8LXN8_9BURK|nr:WzyE family oligosaccharide polymerase [Paraburkholderia rhizosphaerae]TDY53010.1 WzyE protein [Paraburkholderia rhizosphaerae]